jgi:hypothetical protein
MRLVIDAFMISTDTFLWSFVIEFELIRRRENNAIMSACGRMQHTNPRANEEVCADHDGRAQPPKVAEAD